MVFKQEVKGKDINTYKSSQSSSRLKMIRLEKAQDQYNQYFIKNYEKDMEDIKRKEEELVKKLEQEVRAIQQ